MPTDITREQKLKIWEELVSEGKQQVLPIQEGEMTIRMFAEQTGLSLSTAARMLHQHVKDGTLSKRNCLIQGKNTLVFTPVNPF